MSNGMPSHRSTLTRVLTVLRNGADHRHRWSRTSVQVEVDGEVIMAKPCRVTGCGAHKPTS